MNKTNHLAVGFLEHPEVVDAIEGTLRNHHVRREDVDDGVAEVQLLTLEHLEIKEPPADLAGWKALCATIARNWRTKAIEKERAHAKVDAGLSEKPDAYAGLERGAPVRDPIDTRRLLEVLASLFREGEMPEDGVDILDCVQAGMTYKEIGEELGLSESTVRGRLDRMRRKFLTTLAKLGVMVTHVPVMLVVGPSSEASREEIPEPPAEVPEPPPRGEAARRAM